MLKADLHMHSTISDGSNPVEELIERSIARGLDAIAVTDHDTLEHQEYIPKCTAIKVITGVEISAFDPATSKKAHIIGYNIKISSLIENFTKPILEMRHENSLKQIEILKKEGYNIEENLLNRAAGRYIYKQHIMEYLLSQNIVDSMFGSFYKSVFKNGGICDFDVAYVDVFEAVEIIKSAGGKSVLAHSGQQQNFYLIDSLVELGLNGLEYNHYSNSDSDKKIIKEYADKHGLFLTGGSDYHGTYSDKHINIGDNLSPASGIEALLY